MTTWPVITPPPSPTPGDISGLMIFCDTKDQAPGTKDEHEVSLDNMTLTSHFDLKVNKQEMFV